MAANAAALRGITKQYKDFTLGPVDMTVPAGSIVGLIGENGAGKTTLLKILCGVNRADDGTISFHSSLMPSAAAWRGSPWRGVTSTCRPTRAWRLRYSSRQLLRGPAR